MRRLILLTSLLATGCGPPPKDPAVAAGEGLVRSVLRADPAGLVALLTPASRRQLAIRLGLDGDAAPAALVERLAIRPDWRFEMGMPAKARLDPDLTTRDRKVVVVPMSGGAQRRLTVERIDGEWRVDLFASR